MKVNANPMAAFQRETAPGKAMMNRPDKAAPTPQNEARPSVVTPPGLHKVMNKLEALGDSRTQGQNVAMSRIERNLAKYVETQQAMAAPPAPANPAPEPPSDPQVGENVEEIPLLADDSALPEAAGQPELSDTLLNS